eukprot:m.983594 g.983594  ORF g.983594 m.983594 type:complete len:57 (-) comp23974_c0_seq2:3846-4016(-)
MSRFPQRTAALSTVGCRTRAVVCAACASGTITYQHVSWHHLQCTTLHPVGPVAQFE